MISKEKSHGFWLEKLERIAINCERKAVSGTCMGFLGEGEEFSFGYIKLEMAINHPSIETKWPLDTSRMWEGGVD